ncbi:hypothetical protein BDN70DRAFT_902279 [Pholiota conissans]|uniref:Uncharacterized protein n=1 Tax=Pholiota conissans TaxID=109636 RepID=A0A9P6CL36_9AGAR|nr:hypothetical protein BDN70DRAFT_902279 [Pholiota conissans]
MQELDHSIQHMPLYAAISLARICNKGEWLFNALETIVLSKNAKDVVELMRGGIDDETIEKIIGLRERFSAGQKRDIRTVIRAICEKFPELDKICDRHPALKELMLHAVRSMELEKHLYNIARILADSVVHLLIGHILLRILNLRRRILHKVKVDIHIIETIYKHPKDSASFEKFKNLTITNKIF